MNREVRLHFPLKTQSLLTEEAQKKVIVNISSMPACNK